MWMILICVTAYVISCACENSPTHTMLGLNYSQIKAPKNENGGPVEVQIGLYILDIRFDEDVQMLQFDCYLRTIWQDNRINVPSDAAAIQLDTSIVAKLWVPNTFFVHVQSVSRPMLLSDASGIMVYRNKTIFHSSLYLTKYSCALDYHRYPMDTQKCTVRIESYGYSNESMLLSWHYTGIEWEKSIVLRSFYLDDIRTKKPGTINYFDGSYSELSFEVHLSRKVRNSILAVYVPSFMLIFVSWLSLWVPPKLVPGRMVLAITTLLTLTALFNANLNKVPEVSYVKAIDVWTLACIVFVFGTIVEYIAVLRMSRDTSNSEVAPAKGTKGGWIETRCKSGVEKAELLEKVYRIASVVAFVIFNIVYWSYYLTELKE